MIYLNTNAINSIDRDWPALAEVIVESICTIGMNDFSQPIKPYLRYGDTNNRIIAMPGYLGGDFAVAGIKWIASFPLNTEKGIARANSVTILNEAHTGIPFCTINTPLISTIRTVSVTAAMIRKFHQLRGNSGYIVGISGFGPIGRMHLEMVHNLLSDAIRKILLYDIAPIDFFSIPLALQSKVQVVDTIAEAFGNADIFITATVAKERYIIQRPKPGSLHLNISLRDYSPGFRHHVTHIVVDDWNEVCRENTDIEQMHVSEGLRAEDTLSLVDIFSHGRLNQLSENDVIMFNPMGMAVFDLAIAQFYYREALRLGYAIQLEN